MTPAQIGALIRERRERLDWSRPKMLSESKSSFTREHARKIEEGETTPPPEKLDQLLRPLGLRLIHMVIDRENPRHMMWLRLWKFCNEADEILITQGIGSMLAAWERQQESIRRN